MAARGHRRAPKQQAALPSPSARFTGVRPALALAVPLGFTLLLVALGFLPAIRENRIVQWSFWGAGAVLVAWNAALLAVAQRRGRTLAVDIAVYKQHYLQACAQGSVLLYWGAYWHPVYDAALLIVAQLAFAYAFDALLTWSRRDTYTIGFGPFPVIFSTNLFLWFKPDWFYLQFLMVAVGFMAKQLITWNKEGRQGHIFNPSSFPLAVFSLVLIITGTTGITWGEEIATTQFNPPHIYLLIFLVSLPAQFLFGVTPMTLAAVATTYVLGLLYLAVTGTALFVEPPIPIAIFLGMHLLFTDPSTSPRTELGRLIFGVLYGSAAVALFLILGRLGVPTFYDKLLPVPILNLMIRGIDRAARSDLLKRVDPGTLGRGLTPRLRHLAYMSVWGMVFVAIQALTGTDGMLARGDSLMTQGLIDEAIVQYRELVRIKPNDVEAQNKLGFALIQAGQVDQALATIRRTVELQPDNPEAHNNLGVGLSQGGRFEEAIAPLRRAVELNPDYFEAHYNLANAYSSVGQSKAAVEQFREALRGRPDWPAALAALAWIEATAGDTLRDPQDALRLASRAAELSERRDAQVLDVLGAAYAAAGQFSEASRTAEAAAAIASTPELTAEINEHLRLYRAGQALVIRER